MLADPAAAASCPNEPSPTCADGERLKMKLDSNDCLVATFLACPAAAVPVCKSTEALKTAKDESGCGFSYCASAE